MNQPEKVPVDPKDLLDRIADQRNKALDEGVQLYALLEAAKREIAALKDKYEKPGQPVA